MRGWGVEEGVEEVGLLAEEGRFCWGDEISIISKALLYSNEDWGPEEDEICS